MNPSDSAVDSGFTSGTGPRESDETTRSKSTEVAVVMAEVLGIPAIAAEDDFILLGGTSMHAIRIAQRLSRQWRRTVRTVDVLGHPTPAALAEYLAHLPVDNGLSQPVTLSSAEQLQWPLSSAQRRIWMLHELDPARLDHLVTISLELHGVVDLATLSAAWTSVLAHHPTLRMRVSVVADEPFAIVDAESSAVIPYLDLVRLPVKLHERLITERLSKLRNEPIALEAGPITRALLIRREDRLYQLELIVHHIACDGWSLALLVDDLVSAYVQIREGQQPELPSSPATYANYVAWEREVETVQWDEMEDHILQRLTPLPEALRLPIEPKDWDEHQDGDEIILPIDEALVLGLGRTRAARRETSLTLGLAALGILLARLTGQDTMIVAVPVANRPAPEYERIVGDFVNTALVRLDLSHTTDLNELLRRVGDQTADVLATQSFPFDRLLSRLRLRGFRYDTPGGRVALAIQNFLRAEEPPAEAGFSLSWLEPAERQSKFDLVFTLDESLGSSRLIVTFRPSLFRKETVEAWAGQYLAALAHLVRALDAHKEDQR